MSEGFSVAAVEERRRRRVLGPELLAVILVLTVLARALGGDFVGDRMRLWSTLFVSITFQALPFLVLGVLVSGLLAAFVSPAALARVLPSNTAFSVPVAGIAGVALPGCECGSVPIAGRLVANGAAAGPALAFLLAAPAINPVVMISTAVAFPGQPGVVAARFSASLAAALIMGWLFAGRSAEALVEKARHRAQATGSKWKVLADTSAHDLLHAGGYLVVGAMAAATLRLVVPPSVLEAITGNELVSILVMALLAVLLSICSEADAFVAAGLPQFSLTSRLVFMVVGPAVDLKLVALQSGVFGRKFAMRFAPVALLVTILTSVIAGAVLL
jgi:uncharacterized protein